jgi:anti-anti-sigma factor
MSPFVVVRLDNAALVWTDRQLDGTVTPVLHQLLQELFELDTQPLVIDLVGVSSIDDGGITVLAAAAVRAGQLGFGLELRLPGGNAARVRDASGLRHVLVRAYPTMT